MDRKSIKKEARQHLKHHYGLFVITMLIAIFLGTVSSGSADILSIRYKSITRSTSVEVFKKAVEGDIKAAVALASDNLLMDEKRDVNIGKVQLGYQDGIIAEILNKRASGSFIASISSVVFNAVSSPQTASIILMVAALFFIGLESVFVSQVYRVVYTRVFLEARMYKKVEMSSFAFLFRTKKWIHTSVEYFKYCFTLFLWWFTVVGGIIKHYSYSQTRFILAENPSLSAKEAMKLSETMTKGHKFDLFKLDISFIGWYFLSFATGRLLDIFFLIPYKETVYTEYFVKLREHAKKDGVEAADLLFDDYLYEKADISLIDEAYADVIRIMNEEEVTIIQPSLFRSFVQNVFGVVLTYDDKEKEYRKIAAQKAHVSAYRRVVMKDAYPLRLYPLATVADRNRLENTMYMRHYSLSSIFLIFFTFAFVGWLWEVSIHLVVDGVFVNRGSLHGPWLPIYGVGAVIILTVLYRLRFSPVAEFFSAILLCGIVEYAGSFALETIHGKKWWDYSGYFLNINGRVCAEGLLVFGLAGVAAVYFIAPMLDNNFSKIKQIVRRCLCIVLAVAFITDFVYSQFYPNVGAGITDYEVEAYP